MGCQLEPDNVRQVFKEIPDNGLISLALVNCNLRMSSGLVVQEIEIANLPAGPTVYQIGALYGGAPNNSLDESSSFGKALREKYGQPNCRRKNTSQLCFARGTLQMTIGHSDENRDIFEVSFSESRVVVKPSNSPSEESQNANNLQHSDLLANDYARERFKAKAAALPITKF